jgi:hypothetical protein
MKRSVGFEQLMFKDTKRRSLNKLKKIKGLKFSIKDFKVLGNKLNESINKKKLNTKLNRKLFKGLT